MHPARDSIGSLSSQGRICLRATLGASSPSPHSPDRLRLKASSSGDPQSKVGHEHSEQEPVRRLIRSPNSANQVTKYTDDAASNMLSVVKRSAASGYTPSLTSIKPNVIRCGDVKSIALASERLQVDTHQMPRSIPAMSGIPHPGSSLR